jgi:hypothetical protein
MRKIMTVTKADNALVGDADPTPTLGTAGGAGRLAPLPPVQRPTATNGASTSTRWQQTGRDSHDAAAIAAPAQGITCFVSGTMLLSLRGEVPVEELRAGDQILTMHGMPSRQRLVRVRRSHIDLARQPDPMALAPILIKTDALMPGAPIRDLRVSPGQGILLDGCLVPARLLVNGTTIVQESQDTDVTYHYLWLKAHGLLIADGALTESSFEDGGRRDFGTAANIASIVRGQPGNNEEATPAVRCAPLLLHGPLLADIQRRLTRLSRGSSPLN